MICALVALIGPPNAAVAAPLDRGDDRWAVIIGIDTFQGRTRPNIGAVGDARAFQELLQRDGWREDRVRVLINEQATQDGIRQAMQWLVDNCSATSYCLFHYSGHARQTRLAGGSYREYLWPHDNRFISDVEFSDYMRRLKGYAWVDVSACEAGGFDHGISSPRRLFTGASQAWEKAFEYPPWSQSVWTGTLVQQAMLGGAGDSDGDGHVTLREAIHYASAESARITRNQQPSPQHPYVAGGEETDWFPPPVPESSLTAARKNCILLIICL